MLQMRMVCAAAAFLLLGASAGALDGKRAEQAIRVLADFEHTGKLTEPPAQGSKQETAFVIVAPMSPGSKATDL